MSFCAFLCDPRWCHCLSACTHLTKFHYSGPILDLSTSLHSSDPHITYPLVGLSSSITPEGDHPWISTWCVPATLSHSSARPSVFLTYMLTSSLLTSFPTEQKLQKSKALIFLVPSTHQAFITYFLNDWMLSSIDVEFLENRSHVFYSSTSPNLSETTFSSVKWSSQQVPHRYTMTITWNLSYVPSKNAWQIQHIEDPFISMSLTDSSVPNAVPSTEQTQ